MPVLFPYIASALGGVAIGGVGGFIVGDGLSATQKLARTAVLGGVVFIAGKAMKVW